MSSFVHFVNKKSGKAEAMVNSTKVLPIIIIGKALSAPTNGADKKSF